MHGIVFNQLFKFVRESHGDKVLDKVLKDVGLESKFYDAMKSHPDEDIEKIISSLCKSQNVTRDMVLMDFGKYITPGLLKIYSSFIKPEWDVMDLLENIETTIHRAVRMNNPEADPPALVIKRIGINDISITYSSKRKMIQFGIGIIKALEIHFKVRLNITLISQVDHQVLNIKRI